MQYSPLINKAIKLCYEVHKDQYDKSGIPYVFHPMHLAEEFLDEDLIIVALLHDVLEDSKLKTSDLLQMGFNEKCVEAIDLLTRKKEVSYMEYIRTLKHNFLAKEVKLADLRHNSNLNRLESKTEEDIKRVRKYQKAIKEIMKCDDEIVNIYYEKFNDGPISFYTETTELTDLIDYECNNSRDYFQVKEWADKRRNSIALCIERNAEVLLIVPTGSFYLNEQGDVKYATGKYKQLLKQLWRDDLFHDLFLDEIIRMKNGYYDIVMADYRITIYD